MQCCCFFCFFLLCITFHRSLRALGIRLMSLANTYTHSNGLASTIHVLEAADIRWLGLNSKQHEIVMAGGKKFGFLAFCGVHRECIESPSFPFAPLKYNPKVATGAVSELKEVSVQKADSRCSSSHSHLQLQLEKGFRITI